MAKGALYWRHKKDGKWTYQRIRANKYRKMTVEDLWYECKHDKVTYEGEE